jgi:ankyrin repeat protein
MPLTCINCGEENSDLATLCSACGESLSQEKAMDGLLDNRYEVLASLKAGGMGCVYRARDTRLDTVVAVKKMLSPATTPEEMEFLERRFKEEAKLLSQLHHGGLPKVTDFFTGPDPSSGKACYYIVMTFVEGQDLESIIGERKEPFPLGEALDYFTQILQILAYLHCQKPPVIYRDLKPSNIMVREGKIFLVDFGIARIFDHRQAETTVASYTPGYASPEHYGGTCGPRSDFYSLGVVMHQILTGKDPLAGELFSFESPQSINPLVPPALGELIMSMLEPEVESRPVAALKILDILGSLPVAQAEKVNFSGRGAEEIFEAIERKDLEKVRRLLDAHHDALTVKDARGSSPLHAATSFGTDDIAFFLLESGAEVNAADADGNTPLFIATQKGDLPLAEILLSHGASWELGTKDGNTPLHAAALEGHRTIASFLLKKGADPGKRNRGGWTSLHNASCYGHRSLVELFIEAGAPIDERNNSGWSSLHWAVDRCHEDIVLVLLSRGADVNAITATGETPLHMAVKKGYRRIVEHLLAGKALIDAKDNEGWTPLHMAASKGNKELAEYLIAGGASLAQKENHGRTPRDLAREKHHWELENTLQTYGSQPIKTSKSVFDAIAKNDVEALDGFIYVGVGLDAKNRQGWTPLHWAIESGHHKMVTMLLSAGADINIKAFDGKTPLHWAVKKEEPKILEILINHHARMNIQDEQGMTPLHHAARSIFIEGARLLLSGGAPVNLIDEGGRTPLHWAAEGGDRDLVQLLLSFSASREIPDMDGKTACARALEKGHMELRYLLDLKCLQDELSRD